MDLTNETWFNQQICVADNQQQQIFMIQYRSEAHQNLR